MDTDPFYLAMSGDTSDTIAKPGLRQANEINKKN